MSEYNFVQMQQMFNNIENKLTEISDRINNLEERISNVRSQIESINDDQAMIEDNLSLKEKIINEILDNFDFEKVERAMSFLNWKWTNEKGADIPTAKIIKDHAKELLNETWDKLETMPFDDNGWKEWQIETGGLEVWVAEDKFKGHFANLRFILEEWDVEP